jgi:hypothetical protein
MAWPIRSRDLVAIAIALVASDAAHADPAADATRLQLADHFYARGEYYRAVGAYEELQLFTTDPALSSRAAIRIALAFHHGHQIDDAVAAYDRALAGGLDLDTAGLVRIARAMVRADPDAPDLQRALLADLIGELAPLAGATDARYQLLATYHLARLTLADGDRAGARTLRDRAGRRCGAATQPACAMLPRLDAALALPPARVRTPAVAAGLSAVVPGLGSLYNGHRVDAIYYVALTAGAGLVAWDIHDPSASLGDQKTSFYLMASLATVFYTSSIVQGWLGTKRFNEVERLEYRRRVLRATAVPLPIE